MEVQGIHTPQYFVVDKGQLFYKFKGFQNLPIPCRGHKVYLTNVKDILLLREDKTTEVKLLDIRPQDVANTTELRSLRKEISAWAKMSCQSSAREPADSQPHHRGYGTFVLKRGEVIYQYSCPKVTVKSLEKDKCYADIPYKHLN